MPSPKTHRRGGSEEKNRKGRLAEKAKSFHGHGVGNTAELLGRPRTVPELISGQRVSTTSTEMRFPSKLTKLLFNVTVQRCLGAVQVLMSSESTVEELIAAALRQYEKEGRRSALPSTDPADYGLHYSQFSLEGKTGEDPLNFDNGGEAVFSVQNGRRRQFHGGVGVFSVCCLDRADSVMKLGSRNFFLCLKNSTAGTESGGAAPGCSSEVDRFTKIGMPWIKFMDILL